MGMKSDAAIKRLIKKLHWKRTTQPKGGWRSWG
jgi:hypothetical protein